MPSFITRLQSQKTIAAIDLGSNALRAVIVRKSKDTIEVIKNLREPLRLGEDVFQTGAISDNKMQKTEEAFIKLLHNFAEFNVTETKAMATSAMREASNGALLSKRILDATGIEIQTIKGTLEAKYIYNAVLSQIPDLRKKTGLLMDIGGGSTELIIVKKGVVLSIHSFNVGTVRLMKLNQRTEVRITEQVKVMKTFIEAHLVNQKPELFIGTGGNLRRIGKIRKKTLGKSSSEAEFKEIQHMEEAILSMSYVDRIRRLELDQNRADVILPAIMLTHHLMEKLKIGKILLPKVGLKEGIILSMLPSAPKNFILKD